MRANEGGMPGWDFASVPGPAQWWRSTEALWDAYLGLQHDTEQIGAIARMRLAHLVEVARQGSPVYAAKLNGIDTSADDLLARLPVAHKCELMARFDDWAIDRRITRAAVDRFMAEPGRIGQAFLGRYLVCTSSGTTGIPGIFVHDEAAVAVYDALETVRYRQFGPSQWPLATCMGNDRYALLAATGGHFAGHAMAARLAHVNPWFARAGRVISIMQPLPALCAAVQAFAPTLLATYPTVADVLAHEQIAGRLRLAPREIWTGGEHLSAPIRARIERAFQCRVRNAYGASEFLPIAWDCGHGALHVNADWIIVEPVDAHFRPAPAGRPSHTTLITNLANHTQPFIRYDIGDRVVPLRSACPCGSPFPALRVEGRTDDILSFASANGRAVRLLPLALETALEENAGMHSFQLVQLDAATIELRLDAAAARIAGTVQRCRAALGDLLATHGVAHVHVVWHGRTPQRDARSGKLRRVIAATTPSRSAQPTEARAMAASPT